MKKLIVLLTILMLAVPAMATITVTATCSGTASPYTVTVSYATTGETLPPRAFGLLISCDANGTIGSVTANKASYYAAPGTFNYNGTAVTTWGNPIVPVTAGKSFILEVGSLYASNDPCVGHRTQPALSGTLLTFPLTLSSSTAKSTISVAADSARGGVVREDPSVTGNVILTGCVFIPCAGCGECFPTTSNYSKQYADWKTYRTNGWTTEADSWCGCSPANPTYPNWKYQCLGDADGKTSGAPNNYRVYTGDYTMLISNWQKKMGLKPTGADPRVDFDHKSSGAPNNYRVYTADYTRLVSYWQKKDSQLPSCPCPKPDGQN